MPQKQRRKLLTVLDRRLYRVFLSDFGVLSHDHQVPPPDGDWTTWLLLGGRGAGKTRTGAEWVRGLALGIEPFAEKPVSPIALIGETEHDAREVMVEGVAGLIAAHERYGVRPEWISSRRRLEWPNGAVAQIFSAEDPDSLRGFQFGAAWSDELAKWKYDEPTFDMLQFGLRLGERPRQIVTTTPRPTPLLKRLMDDPRTVVSRAGTRENAHFLAPAFLSAIVDRYAGTRLGRQELDGEIIADRTDALWSRALIESCRVADAPPLARIVVAIDPPASATKRADACGIVAAGIAEDGMLYVLADETVSGASPAGWAAKAIALWRRLEADVLVAELSLVECPAFSLTLLHALWAGFEPAIAGFGNLSGLLMAYFGARFSVLGVYVSSRGREKQALVTGAPVPGVLAQVAGQVAGALTGKKKA